MFVSRLTTLSSALVLSSAPAFAITPDEVWSGWQEFLTENYGATLESSGEIRSGEALVISDLTITTEAEEGSVEAVIASLRLENIGNGAVRIEMSDTIPIAMAFPTEEGESALVSMIFGQPGADLIAEGTADDVRYTFAYPTMTIGQFEMSGGGMPDEQPVTLTMSMNGLEGFVSLAGTDVRSYDTASTLASLDMNMSFTDVEDSGEGSGLFTLNMTDLSQRGTGSVGSFDPNASLSELVTSGTTQDGTATFGPTTYTLAADGPEGRFEMASAVESGSFAVLLGKQGLKYSGVNENVTVTVGGSSMPIPPVTLQIAKAGGEFEFPVVPGSEPQDFGMLLDLSGVEIDETLWSIFDPSGAIPRDPASLVLDLSGTGVLSNDITDPEVVEELEMTPPGELSSININQLLLSLAGAELTGTGQFTFSNATDVPMPAGVATLALTGGNALLDTLVGMGLIPEEQAMGARMMLGLFARPVGDDQLVSEIEVTEDGQVLANGQRIR